MRWPLAFFTSRQAWLRRPVTFRPRLAVDRQDVARVARVRGRNFSGPSADEVRHQIAATRKTLSNGRSTGKAEAERLQVPHHPWPLTVKTPRANAFPVKL